MSRHYWKFYWPLGAMGILMLVGKQVQNGVLARYPDAVRELATFSFAAGLFSMVHAAIVFIPQMTTVLARSKPAHRVCIRFTLLACAVLTVPIVIIAFTPLGEPLLAGLYSISGQTLTDAMLYLKLLCPLVMIDGVAHYFQGLLIQSRRSGMVTTVNVARMSTGLVTLLAGLAMGLPAITTVTGSMLLAGVVHLAVTAAAAWKFYRLPDTPDHQDLTFSDVLHFFWPTATTSVMFAVSRPVIFAYANRTSGGEHTVAALRVAFDFSLIFHSPINQFRHFFVTFADDDRAGVRRFMTIVMAVMFVTMVLVAATPISTFVFTSEWLMGIDPDVAQAARRALWVLCGFPLVVTLRNFYHGDLMTRRRTHGMAAGGVMRVGAIWAFCAAARALGWLDEVTAAAALLLGFTVEALTAMASARWLDRADALAAPADARPEQAPS